MQRILISDILKDDYCFRVLKAWIKPGQGPPLNYNTAKSEMSYTKLLYLWEIKKITKVFIMLNQINTRTKTRKNKHDSF